MKDSKAYLLIIVVAFSFFLCCNQNLPVTDPVEANYALTAKEMVEQNEWLSPMIYGQYWFDKPIMIYWLIGLSYKVFGVSAVAARFPAALFGVGSLLYAYWFSKQLFNDKRIAGISVCLLATTLQFWILGRMVITDMVLFFYSSIAVGNIYLYMRTHHRWIGYSGFAAAGLAVLTKGPVGIVLPGMIVFIYGLWRNRTALWNCIACWPGWLVFLAVIAPWYLYMIMVHGNAFVDSFLGLHNYLRATVSEHPKDNVIYYYLVLFPLSLMPWTGVFFRSILDGWKRSYTHYSFLLFWCGGIIGFYSFMATKYLTYVFPAIFPAILLCGVYVAQWIVKPEKRLSDWAWVMLPVLIFFMLLAYGERFLPVKADWTFVYVIGLSSSFLILYSVYRDRRMNALSAAILGTAGLALFVICGGMAGVTAEKSMADLKGWKPDQSSRTAIYGEYSASAVFYSSQVIEKLQEKTDGSEKNPWQGKYTMPKVEVNEFLKSGDLEQNLFILVRKKDAKNFLNDPRFSGFVLDMETKNIDVYKKSKLKL